MRLSEVVAPVDAPAGEQLHARVGARRGVEQLRNVGGSF
jgi:hypothetical protein